MPRASPSSRAVEALGFALVLLALLLALHRGAAFSDRLLAPFDILGGYEPWRTALDAGRAQNPALSDQVTLHPQTPIAAGRLVHHFAMTLWNPFQGCGVPLHANSLSAQLYPLMWLHALLSRHAALLAIGLAKGMLAGVFLFLLLRRRGASLLASALAGLAFPISGFLGLWLGHQHTAVASLLPLLLWLVDRAASRPTLARLAGVGLASGAALLAGHLETALHVLAMAIAYATCACLGHRGPFGSRALRLAKLAAGFVVGALISMAQVIPFAEYSLYSAILPIRHDPLYRFHNAARDLMPGELGPAASSIMLALCAMMLTGFAARSLREARIGRGVALGLLAAAASLGACTIAFRLGLLDSLELLLDPERHGTPLAGRADGNYSGYLLFIEMNCGYASVGALLLALAGMSLRRQGDRGSLFFAAMLFGSLAIVFEWPLIAQLVANTPVLREAKNKRLLLVSSLATLVLAAKGLDALRRAARAGERRALLAPLAAAAVVAIGIFGGRAIVKPEPRVATPAVPVAEPTPSQWAATRASDVAAGRAFGNVRRSEKERLVTGSIATFDGYVFAREPLAAVSVRLTGFDARTDDFTFPLADAGSADVIAARPPGWRAYEFRAEVGIASLPTGRYGVNVAARGDGDPIELHAAAIHVDRPGASRGSWLFGVAALAAIALLFVAPALEVPLSLALIALVAADLFRFVDGFNPAVDPKWDFPPTPALEFLRSKQDAEHPSRVFSPQSGILPANVATAYGLADTRNYDSVDVGAYSAFLMPLTTGGSEGATRAPLDGASRMFDLLAVRWWIAPRGSPPPAPHFAKAFDGEVTVFEDTRALPRAWIVPHAASEDAVLKRAGAPPGSAALVTRALKRALDLGQLDPAATVVVDDARADGVASELAPPAPAATPRAARFLPDDDGGFDAVALEASLDAPGWLVLADTWMPGWTARVDGVATPVLRAFSAFRAVRMPAGTHRIDFAYAPASARIGVGLTLGGLALALLGLLSALRRRAGAA